MAASKPMYRMKTFFKITTGATILFGAYSIYEGNEKFYTKYLMPAVRYLPPELSHNLAVLACKYKIFPAPRVEDEENLSINFFSRTISNPFGIAAGFDKHGEAVEGLEKIGFGFIEIGSVTPQPQPGNPSPRLFRLPEDLAVINRYGFNSEGHQAVYDRLTDLKNHPPGFQGVLGVNLGKNKNSPSALEDYVKGVNVFGPVADYLVINVSSPNTPGLRDLQAKSDLEALLQGVIKARDSLSFNSQVPVLLKLSPDLNEEDVNDVISVITKPQCKVDGLIVSNTTVARESLKNSEHAQETGGLSGAPLRSKSTQMIAYLYKKTKGKIPIIGVGGIFNGQDAFEKIEAGASSLQIYTAFVYGGPPVLNKLKRELSEILKEKGFNNLEQAVGSNYKAYLKG